MGKKIKMGSVGWERGVRVETEFLFFNFSSTRFFFIFTEIGPRVFIGTEGKVDLRDESYAWTPKS